MNKETKQIIRKIQNKPLLYAIEFYEGNNYLYTDYCRKKIIALTYIKQLKINK
jgi:hypothetical protein